MHIIIIIIIKAPWITTVYEMCYKNKLALPCLIIIVVVKNVEYKHFELSQTFGSHCISFH